MVYDSRHQRQPQHLRYQWWCSRAPTEHAESPWESSTSKQLLQMIVVEAGIELIILVRTPIENCYGHGRHIYRTPKPLKRKHITAYMEPNHIPIMMSYILPKLRRP
jgi:hypothetical protein